MARETLKKEQVSFESYENISIGMELCMLSAKADLTYFTFFTFKKLISLFLKKSSSSTIDQSPLGTHQHHVVQVLLQSSEEDQGKHSHPDPHTDTCT